MIEKNIKRRAQLLIFHDDHNHTLSFSELQGKVLSSLDKWDASYFFWFFLTSSSEFPHIFITFHFVKNLRTLKKNCVFKWCVYVWVCAHECSDQRTPEALDSPGAEVPGSCVIVTRCDSCALRSVVSKSNMCSYLLSQLSSPYIH